MGEFNNSQKRYLLSVLSEINHHLEIIELLLQEKTPLFHPLRADLAPAERTGLHAFIGTLRAEILAMSNNFNLHQCEQPLSVRWSIATHLEFAGVELQELTRSKLAGYGALDDNAYRSLRLQIDRVQQMLALQSGKLSPTSPGNKS
ncbi:MAG: hypothetical protein KGL00_06715 [Gammaproteobacteria bacterium]|nr:hypothetical protein [Gammaproteobacteria bacterium]